MDRFTPLSIGCLDSAITAERSLTSRSISGESPPRFSPEAAGDSTARAAFSRRGGQLRRRRAGEVNKRRLGVEFLKGRIGEVEGGVVQEEEQGWRRAMATSWLFVESTRDRVKILRCRI